MSEESSPIGRWALMTMESDSGSALFRVRTDHPEDPQRAAFEQSLVIRWEYEGEAGLPDIPTRAAMEEFEDAVADLVAEAGCSYLMLVTTGMGQKEWVYYVADPADFMCRFNGLLHESPAFPLRILCHQDPEWSYWSQVRERCEEEGENG